MLAVLFGALSLVWNSRPVLFLYFFISRLHGGPRTLNSWVVDFLHTFASFDIDLILCLSSIDRSYPMMSFPSLSGASESCGIAYDLLLGSVALENPLEWLASNFFFSASGCCGLYFPSLTILIGFSTYINLKHYFMYKDAATGTSRFHYGFYSIMVTLIIYRINPSMAAATEPINPYHKSLSASDKYPTMHHFVTEMCTYVHISVTKWCIVEYGTGILWDLCDRSISSVPSSPQFFSEISKHYLPIEYHVHI